MKKKSKEQVYEMMVAQGVLPMFCHTDIEICKSFLQALYKGGVRVVEFTDRSSNSLEVFSALKIHAEAAMPDMLLGAGTIMNAKEAKAFVQHGADFIIAPIMNKGVAKYCRDNKIFWCPGAATLTEIIEAHILGASLVKLFPALQLGGPDFVKAVLAPCPEIRLMPTGGVSRDKDNLRAWFQSGIKCVGIGSQLFDKEIVEQKKYALLTSRMLQMLKDVKAIRKQLK